MWISEDRSRQAMRLVVTLLTLVVLGLAVGQANASSSARPTRATWLRDTVSAMHGSRAFVADRVAHRAEGEKLAVVLDIDNTALQTYYAFPRATPVVKRFATFARSRGVEVFFATGRQQTSLTGISTKLRKAGYDFAEVCGRQPGEQLVSGKNRCRSSFEDRGYTLIAMVGNNDTDFTGAHVERAFQLPSYGFLG